ncbi:MAG: TlpA disulfide reductase family protein [Chitinophagaceae bacterium]
MRHLIFFILFLSGIVRAEAQTLNTCTLQQFQSRVLQDNDTLYVVNFWATWCSPCVKELPYFINLSSEMAEQPVKFILMSLDASGDGNKVAAFLNKKKIPLETHLFTEADPNIWINALEPSWQGSIPATFLYRKGAKVSFQEGSFESKKELETFIKNHK